MFSCLSIQKNVKKFQKNTDAYFDPLNKNSPIFQNLETTESKTQRKWKGKNKFKIEGKSNMAYINHQRQNYRIKKKVGLLPPLFSEKNISLSHCQILRIQTSPTTQDKQKINFLDCLLYMYLSFSLSHAECAETFTF